MHICIHEVFYVYIVCILCTALYIEFVDHEDIQCSISHFVDLKKWAPISISLLCVEFASVQCSHVILY